MKYAALLLALAASAPGQIAKPVSSGAVPGTEAVLGSRPWKIARGTFTDLERRLNTMIGDAGTANQPIDLLGPVRGVYLDGYGAVFTAELSLLLTPTINPFNQSITKDTIARVHQAKMDRLPQLRKAMREMLRVAALTMVQLPETQKMVIVVRLDYLGWEDTSGMPGQIMMQSDRSTAMTNAEIKAEEY